MASRNFCRDRQGRELSSTSYQSYGTHTLLLPRIITGPGRYLTRKGEIVTIDSLGGYADWQAAGKYSDGVDECWLVSGRIFPSADLTSPNDIVRPL